VSRSGILLRCNATYGVDPGVVKTVALAVVGVIG